MSQVATGRAGPGRLITGLPGADTPVLAREGYRVPRETSRVFPAVSHLRSPARRAEGL
jgi:hypothetical protein